MRPFVLAVASLLAFGGAAAAADLSLPIKAPMIGPMSSGWTGFYVGLNGGGGIGLGRSDFSVAGTNFATVKNTLPGPLAGVQAGFNYQMGMMVFGLEADFQLSNLTGGISAPCPIGLCNVAALTATYGQKLPWFGTARGRLGLAQSGWLFYLTGGYSYAQLQTSAYASAGGVSANYTQNENRSGWNAGAGIEVLMAGNWTARIEYLYLDFGTRSTTMSFPAVPLSIVDDARMSVHLTRLGVNYKF